MAMQGDCVPGMDIFHAMIQAYIKRRAPQQAEALVHEACNLHQTKVVPSHELVLLQLADSKTIHDCTCAQSAISQALNVSPVLPCRQDNSGPFLQFKLPCTLLSMPHSWWTVHDVWSAQIILTVMRHASGFSTPVVHGLECLGSSWACA